MSRTKTPTGWDLRTLERCAECGSRLRNGRKTKTCPRCGVSLPVARFGHNKARTGDHRDPYCLSCRSAMRSSKARPVGEEIPFASVATFRDGWVTGLYAGQEPLTDVTVVPSRPGPVRHGYVTADRRTVHSMLLITVRTSEGDRLPSLKIPHALPYLQKEPALTPGARVVVVVEAGQVVKLLAVDDREKAVTTLVNAALDPEWPQMDEDGKLRVLRWNAFSPWMLPLALRHLGVEPPEVGSEPVEIPCPFCHEATATVTTTTIECRCLGGWMTADLLLMQRGGVSAEDVYPLLDALEDSYLLAQLEPPVRIETEGGETWTA